MPSYKVYEAAESKHGFYKKNQGDESRQYKKGYQCHSVAGIKAFEKVCQHYQKNNKRSYLYYVVFKVGFFSVLFIFHVLFSDAKFRLV